jgi:hypothetical protein
MPKRNQKKHQMKKKKIKKQVEIVQQFHQINKQFGFSLEQIDVIVLNKLQSIKNMNDVKESNLFFDRNKESFNTCFTKAQMLHHWRILPTQGIRIPLIKSNKKTKKIGHPFDAIPTLMLQFKVYPDGRVEFLDQLYDATQDPQFNCMGDPCVEMVKFLMGNCDWQQDDGLQ